MCVCFRSLALAHKTHSFLHLKHQMNETEPLKKSFRSKNNKISRKVLKYVIRALYVFTFSIHLNSKHYFAAELRLCKILSILQHCLISMLIPDLINAEGQYRKKPSFMPCTLNTFEPWHQNLTSGCAGMVLVARGFYARQSSR